MDILNRVHGRPLFVFKEKIWKHTYQLLSLFIRINHDPNICMYIHTKYVVDTHKYYI